MQVLDFAKYLLALNPEANAARLSLYHYFKNSFNAQDPFTPAAVNGFFARAYSLTHWRDHRRQLQMESTSLIEGFLENCGADWSQQRIDHDIQIIHIENPVDHYELVRQYFAALRTEAEKIRILPDNEDGMVAIRMPSDGSLIVQYFDKLMTVRAGRLEPLCQDLVVKYTARLEPAEGFQHHIQVQPGVTCHFRVNQGLVDGRILRGYTFHKIEDFSGDPVNKIPVLFYPLKRLERFFVNRSTDPLYVELASLLEQAVSLLREGHPEALPLASAALERGQNALNYIFTDDKLLALLLRELSTLLYEKTNRGQHVESTSQ